MEPPTIAEFLTSAQILLENSTLPELQIYLAAYGYTPERIQGGKQLYETALAAHQKQIVEYGDQYGATEAQNQAWTKASLSYMRLIKIARIACKDDLSLWKALELTGERKETLAAWLLQAGQFYRAALSTPEIQSRLAVYGITPDSLQQAYVEYQSVVTAHTIQIKEIGEAQQATKDRDFTLDALDEWISDFRAIAKLALADKPQLLESLGIFVRS